jgi:ATP-dependent RNA helicase DDX56/DBP9
MVFTWSDDERQFILHIANTESFRCEQKMSFLLDEGQPWVQRDFGLDRRLIKALSKIGFVYPTLVQSKCIPIAMEGKDVLVRARTGSGKTIAFALPLLHRVLAEKEADGSSTVPCVRSLILVPTKELCTQIKNELEKLIFYCRDIISIYAVTDENSSSLRLHLQKQPDIIIATPAKIVPFVRENNRIVSLKKVKILVMDEADLILSFGYSQDVTDITKEMPNIFQGLLTSATLSPELDKFKRVVLHSPAVLKLEEEGGVMGHLLQFYLAASDSDKFLILYVFIKLGLLQGKGLIFVNDVNKCYKLKLFLQQFFISAAVLNSEVPANSRQHILDEFNRGVFDYLIATDAFVDGGGTQERDDDDEGSGNGDSDDHEDEEDEESEFEEESDIDEDSDDDNDGDDSQSDADIAEESEELDEPAGETASGKKRKVKEGIVATKRSKPADDADDEGYGVARGIDFQGVNFVINFDFPVSAAAYTHRIGRTARGGATGTALSFVTATPTTVIQSNFAERNVATRDSQVLRQVQSQQPWIGSGMSEGNLSTIQQDDKISDESKMQPAPLQFNMKELDTFRYRVEDVLRGVTNGAVKEYRAAELKREILHSQKLKEFFAENPNDLKVLRHDQSIAHPIKQKHHLKHVPGYLVPTSMKSVADTNPHKGRPRKNKNMSAEKKIQKSKMRDPLVAAAAGTHADVVEAENEADDDKAAPTGSDTGSSKSKFSCRNQWQERHRKGKYSDKKRTNENKLPGSFSTLRKFKK